MRDRGRVTVDDPREGLGHQRPPAARRELAAMMRRRILDRLMAEGVTMIDPATTYVDDTVEIGVDTVLYPGVVLEGRTIIGAECVIGAGCHVSGSRIGDRVTLQAVLRAATSRPWRRARSSARSAICGRCRHVGAGAKIGNFVELKKSRIGRGAKVPHLSYVGDATRGRGGQLRRRHHHLQLRRRRQARDAHRGRRLHRHQLEPRGARHASARAPTSAPAPSSPRTCPGCPRRRRARRRRRAKAGLAAKAAQTRKTAARSTE